MRAARDLQARDPASTGISPSRHKESPVQITEQGAATQRLYAYAVREFDTADGKRARAWTRIGVAFPHKDGTGFNIEVHSFPLDGRIVLFPADLDTRGSDDDTEAEAEAPPVRAAAATGRNGQHQRRR
jgi:hypothetical protein